MKGLVSWLGVQVLKGFINGKVSIAGPNAFGMIVKD